MERPAPPSGTQSPDRIPEGERSRGSFVGVGFGPVPLTDHNVDYWRSVLVYSPWSGQFVCLGSWKSYCSVSNGRE